MMKTTKIILMIGLLLSVAQLVQAQVKIGERPLDIGDERLLEMQAKLGELFIVTDSLEIGITTLNNVNTTNPGDAMMLKLFGYGLGHFNTEQQSYFLGTNANGQVLEFPLRLNLEVTQTGIDTSALIALHNGIDTFGTVDLMPLDTIFATDQNLIDSITRIENTLTTLIGANKSNDLDTIQINELIDQIDVIANDDPTLGVGGDGQQTLVVFYEDRHSHDTLRAISKVDLGGYFATHMDVGDTANVLRNGLFYLNDGTITTSRTVYGASGTRNLTFTEMDSFNVSANNNTFTTTGNTSITSTGTTTVSGDGDVSTTSNLGDVNITSTTGTVDISGSDITLDAAGDTITAIATINLNEYTSKPIETDYANIMNILGIDASGNIINVDPTAILGTEEDSVIYRHNGELIDHRTMWMGELGPTSQHNLYFVSSNLVDTTVIDSTGRIGIGTGNFTPNSTGVNPSDVKLEVNGDILAIRVHSSSDERFKKNIAPIKSAIEKVQSIKGVTYDFRTEEFKHRKFPSSTQVGFIAQNVEEVLPEVVMTHGDGYKAVDYAKITALLNEAIKEQQIQIDNQGEIIKSQEAIITSILSKYQSVSSDLADLKASIKELSNQTLSEE